MYHYLSWIFTTALLGGHLKTVESELYTPRYISPWTWMDTGNRATTDLIFTHGFRENPIKAEVQVRKRGSQQIFPGIKSANVIQLMQSFFRAGVLCLYNKTHVRVMGPPKQGNIPAFIIYAGHPGWIGPNGNQGPFENSTTGEVRVRVWHRNDFPHPEFNRYNIVMSAQSSYRKISHTAKLTPLYASVQLEFDDGWIAEAQGSESHYSVTPNSHGWSGVVFSGRKDYIELWAPPNNTNDLPTSWKDVDDSFEIMLYVVYTYHGWGSCHGIQNCLYTRASVHVALWGNMTSHDCKSLGRHVAKRDTHLKLFRSFNTDTDIVEVTAAVQRCSLPGLQGFHGSGAAMMDGSTNTPVGLVYSFDNFTNQIRIWHPFLSHGFIVKVTGDVRSSDCKAKSAAIDACIWKGKIRDGQKTSTSQAMTTSVTSSTTRITSSTDGRVTTSTLQKASSVAAFSPTTLNKSSPSRGTTMPPMHTSPSSVSVPVSTSDKITLDSTTETSSQVTNANIRMTTDTSSAVSNELTDLGLSTESVSSHTKDKTSTSNGNDDIGKGDIYLQLLSGMKVHLNDLGKNVFVDFSRIQDGYILFTCKTGYKVDTGDFNRTMIPWNNTLTGQPPVCTAKTSLLTTVEIEERTKEIVKNLTIAVNATSKYRRYRQSAEDKRTTSRVIGVVGGFMIGGIIALLFLSDVARLCRYLLVR